MEPEVSDERAQQHGIDVRVARGCCDTLMAEELLDVTRVSSALVEKERGDRMPQGMSGNDWHSRALAGQLETRVECLVG